MKRLLLPKNKFLRLLINVVLIIGWFYTYFLIDVNIIWKIDAWYELIYSLNFFGIKILPILILLIPTFFITRYIWFEKSRNRIFYGLFNKLNFNLKKFEPRIYTTTSNADELKKYAKLRDKSIITEEEFQAKKKKLLDL